LSHRVVADACIGCGACEFACSTAALHKTDSFLGTFVIDPFTCNDCGDCVPKCPVSAIEPDPDWAVCQGHGCPLTSRRLAGVECALWQQRCPGCGTTLWQPPDAADWVCPRCDLQLKVSCPRTRKLDMFPITT